jgi:hypothetical protein
LNIFCDADWAGGSDRKSTSGYIITIAGGAVAWSSKKQASVALSTAEAKYISAMHAAKQVLWHRLLFRELKIELPRTSTIFSDNQAAIAIVHHPEFHACTKHINISYHFLRNPEHLIWSMLILTDLTYKIRVLPDQGGVLRSEIRD